MRGDGAYRNVFPRVMRLFFVLALYMMGLTPGIARAGAAHDAASFSLDASFAALAQAGAAQQEPGYIPYNDCAHWISSFLMGTYGLPDGWASDSASDLITNLVNAGIATVVTGDQQPDSGSLISEADAATEYFSGDSSYPSALDASMVENGGQHEYILAYKWSGDPSSETYSHVALYVGGGQVVAHGTTTDGTFATEGDSTPQAWNWYVNPSDQQDDWQVAIIELSSGAVNAPPTVVVPSASWTVNLAADQTDVTPGTVVTLTAQANQALDSTGHSLEIIDTTNVQVVASCTTGESCTAQITVDSAADISYVAQVADQAQSDPVSVIWEDNAPSGNGSGAGWSVSLTADQTDVASGVTVNLTADAGQDVGPTPYSIAIVDQTAGQTVATCGSGSTCTAQVSMDSGTTETYVAEIVDSSQNSIAQSDPVQVTWEDNGSAGGTPSATGNLGGVDLNGYCQSIGDQGVSLDGATAYDWHCVDSDGNHLGIDMDAACQWQYQNGNAVGVVGDVNDPNSWYCVAGTLS